MKKNKTNTVTKIIIVTGVIVLLVFFALINANVIVVK